MHSEVLDWVRSSLEWWDDDQREGLAILEFGSLDINGSVRSVLQPSTSRYVGIDPAYGKGVDIVADASVFRDTQLFDIVVCCEVFEHTEKWPQIVFNAHRNLREGGLFIATMAGEGRAPHSAIDENPIRPHEYYKNVTVAELEDELRIFSQFEANALGFDTRGRGKK